jgi:hypothetical protein
MLRTRLHISNRLPYRRLGRALKQHEVGELQLAFSERACLVDGERAHACQSLDGFPALEQDASPRGVGNRAQQRGGRANHQRTGRGDHQQRHRAVKSVGEAPAYQRQPQRDRRCAANHRQRVPLLEPLQPALRARLLLLCLLHQLQNALQQRVGCRGAHFDLQHAAAVHRAREHHVAHAFVNGHALACNRRLVDMRFAVPHHPVSGDALAGAGHHAVADLQLFHGYGLGSCGRDSRGGIGLERHQRAHGVATARQGVVLQRVGQREQEQQRRAFGRLADTRRADRRRNHQEVHIEPPLLERLVAVQHAEVAAREVGDGVGEVCQRRLLAPTQQPTCDYHQQRQRGQNRLPERATAPARDRSLQRFDPSQDAVGRLGGRVFLLDGQRLAVEVGAVGDAVHLPAFAVLGDAGARGAHARFGIAQATIGHAHAQLAQERLDGLTRRLRAEAFRVVLHLHSVVAIAVAHAPQPPIRQRDLRHLVGARVGFGEALADIAHDAHHALSLPLRCAARQSGHSP